MVGKLRQEAQFVRGSRNFLLDLFTDGSGSVLFLYRRSILSSCLISTSFEIFDLMLKI